LEQLDPVLLQHDERDEDGDVLAVQDLARPDRLPDLQNILLLKLALEVQKEPPVREEQVVGVEEPEMLAQLGLLVGQQRPQL